MNIKPVGQHIFLEVIKEETKSSIVLTSEPRVGQREYVKAKVIAVGKGTYLDSRFVPNDVVVGDTVLVPKLAIKSVKVHGESYDYTRNVDIEAIIG